MEVPTLVEMLKCGVHFGHRTSKRHPGMEPYIFGEKDGVHILNLEQTQEQLKTALATATELAATGKTILFVGTKRQAAALVKKYAQSCEMPYVDSRWLGGQLTNFKNVIAVPQKLTQLKADREKGALEKYTKKEQLDFDREIERLELLVGGLETLAKLPDAIFVVDLREEKTAVREANQLGIPVMAICDTNVDPSQVAHVIPANDDAIKSIDLILGLMAGAINEGRANPKQAEKNVRAAGAEKSEDAIKADKADKSDQSKKAEAKTAAATAAA